MSSFSTKGKGQQCSKCFVGFTLKLIRKYSQRKDHVNDLMFFLRGFCASEARAAQPTNHFCAWPWQPPGQKHPPNHLQQHHAEVHRHWLCCPHLRASDLGGWVACMSPLCQQWLTRGSGTHQIGSLCCCNERWRKKESVSKQQHLRVR